MLINKERPVRVFVDKHLSLRSREVKQLSYDLPKSFDFDFEWIADWSSPTEFCENSIPRSLSWTVRSPIHPKLKSMLGGGVHENNRQYREAKEANVICLVFLTNI